MVTAYFLHFIWYVGLIIVIYIAAGPLVIIGRHAYFQLFAFDPRVRTTLQNMTNYTLKVSLSGPNSAT